MSGRFTFQGDKVSSPLEKFEWDRIWYEDTCDKESVRVAYIGDSISCATYETANKVTDRKILFSNFATSKALDNPYLYPSLKLFLDQNVGIDAIVINNGLHGGHLDGEKYYELYLELLRKLKSDHPDVPVILALTTAVSDENEFASKVPARNEMALKIADAEGLEVIDLYSVALENIGLLSDGVHFKREGYVALANKLIGRVSEILGFGGEKWTLQILKILWIDLPRGEYRVIRYLCV
jgi:lysophospholipase L1-like esterase